MTKENSKALATQPAGVDTVRPVLNGNEMESNSQNHNYFLTPSQTAVIVEVVMQLNRKSVQRSDNNATIAKKTKPLQKVLQTLTTETKSFKQKDFYI